MGVFVVCVLGGCINVYVMHKCVMYKCKSSCIFLAFFTTSKSS